MVVGLLTLSSQKVEPTFAQTAQSPTGRNPILVWTPQQQAIWLRMKAEYDANPGNPTTLAAKWYKLMKNNADCQCRYLLPPMWPTLMYQITGQTSYADLAINRIISGYSAPIDLNHYREYGTEEAILYDWLRPRLEQLHQAAKPGLPLDLINPTTEQEKFLVMLNNHVAFILPLATQAPIRLVDSDQVTGTYFGIVNYYLATKDHNPTAVAYFNHPQVGGLDPGAAFTLRDRIINNFVKEMGEGGVWLEGTEYNMGTLKLLFMGAAGVKTATGVDHYPEITAYAKAVALAQIHEVSPDLRQPYMWGDIQSPRTLDFYERISLLGVLVGLTQNDSTIGPYIHQLLIDFANQYGTSGFGSTDPTNRFFLFYNPYVPAADWRTVLPKYSWAKGQGLLFFHSGWSALDSLVGFHLPGNVGTVDHTPPYHTNFQVYRNGEWAITHPMDYDGPSDHEGVNSMLFAGLPRMDEYHEPQVIKTESTGKYFYGVTTTGGQYFRPSFSSPPPTFVHEWTRSLFHLPSTDKKSETVIAFDRTNAVDPSTLPSYSRYGATANGAILARMNNVLATYGLKQWIIHTPTQPTATSGLISWTTGKGQQGSVSTLLPASTNKTVVDESVQYANSTVVVASERKWNVRVVPSTNQQWDTFLNVIQVSDSGTALTNSLVESTNKEAQGALVTRANHNDTLVLFNAQQGPNLTTTYDSTVTNILTTARIFKSGFKTNAFTTTTANTDVFIGDLNPSIAWKVSIDNSVPIDLTVSTEGLGQFTISGAGLHSFVVTPQNVASVTLTKTVDKAAANPGDTLTYTINYTNIGVKDATNTVITDIVPAGTTYVANSATAGGVLSGNTLKWTIASPLTVGANGNVSFKVTVD